MTEVKGPILGTVVLAGINPSGEPKFIDGTLLVAGLNASGQVEYLNPDNIGGGSSTQDIIIIQDQKAQNTAGGTFTSGAWRTRDLNTEVTDAGGHSSVASNQVTLQPGSYEIIAAAPCIAVDAHQMRWQNITDGTTTVLGPLGHSGSFNISGSSPPLIGYFTITAQKVFELQHRCQTTQATFGFGNALNVTTEIYSTVFLKKVA